MLNNKIIFISTSLSTRYTLVSSRTNGDRYFRNDVLKVAGGARAFGGKREIPKNGLIIIKKKLQTFLNYLFQQSIAFGNFLTRNLPSLHYIINHIIMYELVRLRNIFIFYVRIAGWQNTLNALFRQPIYFIPILLYGLGGVVSMLFGIGFIDDSHSMQLNSCHNEMTSLVTGTLTDYDPLRFKNSMDYILHFAQDPQLRNVVKQMCQIYEQKIDLQYNMQKIYPTWTDQHAVAIAESQSPHMFVAKVCLATILCFLILILLNINGDEFIPPIHDLPEGDGVSPISLGSSIDGRTTTESPIIDGWND